MDHSSCSRNCWSWRACGVRWCDGGAFVAANVAATVLFAHVVRGALRCRHGTECPAVRSPPRRKFPDSPGKRLDLKASLLPLAAGFACPIQSPELLVDSTLVGFWAEFVCTSNEAGSFRRGRTTVQSAVLAPMQNVSGWVWQSARNGDGCLHFRSFFQRQLSL